MKNFISCDWGTTSLRLRLIKTDDLSIVGGEISDQGIARTFDDWQQPENCNFSRKDFYISMIKNQLHALSKKLKLSLDDIPVMLSGMASSNIGMIYLPYKKLPFKTDGTGFEVTILEDEFCKNKFIIIPGVRTDEDVMRGEETKIIGCSGSLKNIADEQILILPGTHPKHVYTKDNNIVRFKTFMTGEFFDLLSTKSILANSLEKGMNFFEEVNRQGFIDGVKAGQSSNLLQACFAIRVNDVLKNISRQQNFFYLSGLLIGTELNGLEPGKQIILVGSKSQIPYYGLACDILKINVREIIDADMALIKGQSIVLSNYQLGAFIQSSQ